MKASPFSPPGGGRYACCRGRGGCWHTCGQQGCPWRWPPAPPAPPSPPRSPAPPARCCRMLSRRSCVATRWRAASRHRTCSWRRPGHLGWRQGTAWWWRMPPLASRPQQLLACGWWQYHHCPSRSTPPLTPMPPQGAARCCRRCWTSGRRRTACRPSLMPWRGLSRWTRSGASPAPSCVASGAVPKSWVSQQPIWIGRACTASWRRR
mmetsp:Transcript_12712/g.38326  ORF Transcript_12712/g.38326 Transcript_12712/m.38326 type:complete len:207 (+) Transcript_12712:272-892(+)